MFQDECSLITRHSIFAWQQHLLNRNGFMKLLRLSYAKRLRRRAVLKIFFLEKYLPISFETRFDLRREVGGWGNA